MSYIGNEPTSVAFLTDTFSGNGSTTAFTLSAAPATTSSILVAISGVLQDPSTYSVVGTTLTFSPAPPTGTGNISVRFLGIPASGVTTTAYRTVTEFTATSGQTTFSVPSYTPGFIDVYRNGVLLGSADYTASNGVSVVLVNGCTAGDLVEVISFQVSSVLNAMPTTGGTFSGNVLFDSGDGIWNTSGQVGIGTASPSAKLTVVDGGNTFVSSDANGYVRITAAGSSAQLGLFRSVNNVGGGYIGADSNNCLDVRTSSFDTRLAVTQAGLLQFNSGYGSVATAYGCRAWVNFSGTGTVSIRASGNVSSITDLGTGFYRINFTTALPDTSYATTYSDISWGLGYSQAFSTTSFETVTLNSSFAVSDVSAIWIAVFR